MEPEVKVSEDFKSQFKAYQEQQQRRLKSVMEAKREMQDRQKSTGSTKETVRALSELNLFKKGPHVKEDASKSFFEAENEQLQDQLRELRDENCRLYRLMAEKDFEIKELQKRVKEERLALSGVSGLAGDVAATKIVELAKRNREVTAEFESERARVKQLNHRVKELERELQAAAEKIHSLGGDAAGIKESALKKLEGNLAENPEVKALQEKLSTANVKVTEYRNQLQNLKQELKLTQKILAKEVGEDVNIQNLLTNSGSWRGRAQQIVLLQGKVHELEHKLNQQKIRTSLLEMDEGLLAFPDSRKLSVQEKNLLKIRSLEKEKKESLEKLSAQHNSLQKNHEELKKKLDATRARNQMLCGEVKMLKGQIGTLLEKGKHDDELIDALLSQQKQMQEILKGLSQKKGENKEMVEPEIQKQSTLIDELRQLVADREAKVKTLEEEIGQLTHQDKSGAAHPPHSEHSASPEAARTESARVMESSSKVLEAEKELQEEQWQSDSLEQQLEKLQVDPESSTTAQEPALRSRKAQASVPVHVSDREELSAALAELPLESQLEELSRRLGFQLDENKSLKETVTAKGEDFELHQATMEKVRDGFAEGAQPHTPKS
ncbi:coiled-coil domain-containing protein 13 isoform X3 [Melospiza georgiana]|uniref:coiled-coil domain-containing protein 13 isoform X3 n=1 Tax=Melospiza georgiana TaxID=44398 RepID=UPI0025ACD72E|nr:coiled-coil domain-containing protein 13 isoform X3 [Melospiza georgiana]